MTIPSNTLGTQIDNKRMPYAYGCVPTYESATTLTITAGRLSDATDTFDINVPSNLTVSTQFVGAGGLDEGTIQNNTFYAVYVLYDYTHANNPVGMLSAVSKNPVMPSVNGVTYSSYRVVGYIKTSFSTPDITPFNVSGSSNDRTHLWATDQTGLLGGTATTLTPVSLAEGIPSILGISDAAPQSVAAIFTMSLNPTGAGDNGQLWTFDTSINASSVLLGQVVGVLIQGQYVCAADFTNTGDYQIRYIITSTTGATLDIDIDGFTYTI